MAGARFRIKPSEPNFASPPLLLHLPRVFWQLEAATAAQGSDSLAVPLYCIIRRVHRANSSCSNVQYQPQEALFGFAGVISVITASQMPKAVANRNTHTMIA